MIRQLVPHSGDAGPFSAPQEEGHLGHEYRVDDHAAGGHEESHHFDLDG